ncbi:mechanosensitive ion channel protein 10-like [Salvia miltiorrhiza]|uniref:mechanosensitive ion channel protein 10-like n=1 Tax=Salvia miltiorrhiza TaxID=226208 RepID=UPI0025ABB71D|nr:mechanosensitive ion channel protein 10-like [Salvia miltiorrhiza]XP_057776326.1 mechanosensitive ion channel protein 10-like [Salvia miltiorrhiza]XP_057776327.1 mechanosensitive ion channel protein 10-like [Salvia miltiorrhiza]XP_057776328.1 mechanosensitive ion channel protein 10-like [Salvia miltiorrhiza]
MDGNGNDKARKSTGEISMIGNQNRRGDMIINVSEDAKDSKSGFSAASPLRESNDSALNAQKSPPMSYASPETVRIAPIASKPPKIPTGEGLTRRKTLSRSVYSKPKARFGEQSVHIDGKMFDEDGPEVNVVPSRGASPNHVKADTGSASIKDRTVPITPKTPLMNSFRGLDEDEEIYKKVSSRKKLKYRKVRAKVLVEWLIFLCILGCLITSFTVHRLHHLKLWGLHLWKWFALVLVTFSGLLVTEWLMNFVVLLIELNYLLKKKVLYFVFGLKKIVQVCIWLALVLITWALLFREGVDRSSRATTKILDLITWTIASLLIGACLWLLKNLLLKILASSFHVNTFFDRIQESIFHQYILFSLSGKPVMEAEQLLGRASSNVSQFSFRVTKKDKEGKEKKEKEVIDINKLHQMKQEKVSAWTMKMLVDVISNSGLTTISNALDESVYNGGNEQTDKEITNEEEAIAAAYHIFRNVAQPGCTYIDEYDMRRFMLKEEVDIVFPMIDVGETGKIDRKALTEWVVKVYKDRRALAHALTDTKTAVKQLNKLITGILMIIIVVIWLLLTGIATTKVLVVMSSQLVVAVFMFGNTCKTIFEAIIFVFVMHPFDVGDRCVIDGVQMIVEEMNIFTTVFLKADNEKVYYPNSVLSTKPISNFYRSPDMGDSLEFSIDFKTSMEKIGALREKIKKYLEKNPQLWHANHNLVVKEIENVNKIKMALFFNHTMNFQNFAEKSRRRTELVLEMKRIFEELHISYDLLPQDVHLNDSRSSTETSK